VRLPPAFPVLFNFSRKGLLFRFDRLGVELFRFVHSPARTLDGDDDGVMHHAVDDGGGDNRVAEVVAKFFEVDVRGDQR
jgi:hypothetical protein